MSKLMRDLNLAEEARLSIEYAQDRAATHVEAEHAARGRIASNTNRLVEIKALELAEAEARQLAQIRARSERALAAQAEALAEAERKREMAAIERRSCDLDAAREAAAREAADTAAREAAARRTEAERQAAEAASERAATAARATAAAEARRQAEFEQKSALVTRRRAQWSAFWTGARWRPLALIGTLTLLLGAGGGLWLSKKVSRLLPGSGAMPDLQLRIDDNLDTTALRAATARPPRSTSGHKQ